MRELPDAAEELIAEGMTALGRGDEVFAHQLFLRATDHPEAGAEAWAWRGRTAASAAEAVHCLGRALDLDPDNAGVRAHLARAQLRLDHERLLQGAACAEKPATDETDMTLSSFVQVTRLFGGLIAFTAAALWLTAGLMPWLARGLDGLSRTWRLWLEAAVPNLDKASVAGIRYLTLRLPGSDFNALLSAPFIIGFLFLFIGWGLLQGDLWARTAAFVTGAVTFLLILLGPRPTHLSLVIYVGLAAAIAFDRLAERRNPISGDLRSKAPPGAPGVHGIETQPTVRTQTVREFAT